MNASSDAAPEILVTAEEPETEYRISVRIPGMDVITRGIHLDPKIARSMKNLEICSPFELGFEDDAIQQAISRYPRIDLFLPDAPIATLNWESMGYGRIIRRTARDFNFRRLPLSAPFEVGLISTVASASEAYVGLGDAIAQQAAPDSLTVRLVAVRDWDDFRAKIRQHRFHAVQILLNTRFTPSGPQALIGGKEIPLVHVIREAAQLGTRFVLLHDVSEDRRAIASLRWGAQSLPSNSEASVLLCRAAPSARFAGELKGLYSSLIKDESLTSCLAHLDRKYKRGDVSLVAHAGTERGLDLLEDVSLQRRRRQQFLADFARLDEASKGAVPSQAFAFEPITLASSHSAEAPLAEFMSAEPITRQAEGALKARLEERLATADEHQARYPAAWFYHVDAVTETPIPDTQTLTWPPPLGIVLELHFWLDPVKAGIASITETPNFHKPQQVPYPLTLQVTIWSESFEFATQEGHIILAAAGPTDHARFSVTKAPPAPHQAELFIFLRHEGTLIAAFRIEAAITEPSQRRVGAQVIEHAYLASDWFRFASTPTGSALTVFITKKHGALRIFTLRAEGNPWASLGPTESGLYEKNKDIYKEVQTLARRAEQALKQNEKFTFVKEAKQLAKLGYPLFGDIFLQGSEDVAAFVEQYVRQLPPDSNLTIAISAEAQNLSIPWGLLYDRQPPFDFFDAPDMDGFLGFKHNLVVRPSIPYDGFVPERRLPIRLGAAWLEHEETALLRASYRQYVDSGKLSIEPIKAQEHQLPALTEKEFDLVEFFCHGHTKLSGIFTPEEAQQLIATYAKSTPGGEKAPLLMAIEEASDSLLDLNGGFVTLTSLADSLKQRMPGRPLVFLSMCESAQVSAAGTGFVPLLLRRGARAVIGTEGPTLWSLSREMDTGIVARLLVGETISSAFYKTRRELAQINMLALVYTLYGDAAARVA
jgi:hypothetical protein